MKFYNPTSKLSYSPGVMKVGAGNSRNWELGSLLQSDSQLEGYLRIELKAKDTVPEGMDYVAYLENPSKTGSKVDRLVFKAITTGKKHTILDLSNTEKIISYKLALVNPKSQYNRISVGVYNSNGRKLFSRSIAMSGYSRNDLTLSCEGSANCLVDISSTKPLSSFLSKKVAKKGNTKEIDNIGCVLGCRMENAKGAVFGFARSKEETSGLIEIANPEAVTQSIQLKLTQATGKSMPSKTVKVSSHGVKTVALASLVKDLSLKYPLEVAVTPKTGLGIMARYIGQNNLTRWFDGEKTTGSLYGLDPKSSIKLTIHNRSNGYNKLEFVTHYELAREARFGNLEKSTALYQSLKPWQVLAVELPTPACNYDYCAPFLLINSISDKPFACELK